MQWEFPSFLSSRPYSISRKLKEGGVREERSHLMDRTHWMAARDGNDWPEKKPSWLPSLRYILYFPQRWHHEGVPGRDSQMWKWKGSGLTRNSNLSLSRQGTILAADGRKEVTPRNPKESRILSYLQDPGGVLRDIYLAQLLRIWANGKECQPLPSLLNMLLFYHEI